MADNSIRYLTKEESEKIIEKIFNGPNMRIYDLHHIRDMLVK